MEFAGMKRTAALWLTLLTGCSSAPWADMMDKFEPGQLEAGAAHGGVCNPDIHLLVGPPVTAFPPLPESSSAASPLPTTPPVAVAPAPPPAATPSPAPVPAAAQTGGTAPAVPTWRRE
jgi:hypothetical protein